MNLTHSHEVLKTNLNHEWFNTQNSLDSPLDKTTKTYFLFSFIIIYIYIYIYRERERERERGCVMLSFLKLSN